MGNSKHKRLEVERLWRGLAWLLHVRGCGSMGGEGIRGPDQVKPHKLWSGVKAAISTLAPGPESVLGHLFPFLTPHFPWVEFWSRYQVTILASLSPRAKRIC